MNYVHLVGRLGADPVTHPFSSGGETGAAQVADRTLVRFDLAVDRAWSPKPDGQDRPVDWIPILIFDTPAARYAQKALAKGDLISLTGRVDMRRWQDDHGRSRKEVRVIAGDLKKLSGPKRTPDNGGDKEAQLAAMPAIDPAQADTASLQPGERLQ